MPLLESLEAKFDFQEMSNFLQHISNFKFSKLRILKLLATIFFVVSFLNFIYLKLNLCHV